MVKKLNGNDYNNIEEFKQAIEEQLDKLRDKEIDQIEISNISFDKLEEMYKVNVFDHRGFGYCGYMCNDELILSGDTKSAWASIERNDCLRFN